MSNSMTTVIDDKFWQSYNVLIGLLKYVEIVKYMSNTSLGYIKAHIEKLAYFIDSFQWSQNKNIIFNDMMYLYKCIYIKTNKAIETYYKEDET